MIVVAPEADFVARLDAELITKLLRDDDLPFRTDTVSHTRQYNSVLRVRIARSACRFGDHGLDCFVRLWA